MKTLIRQSKKFSIFNKEFLLKTFSFLFINLLIFRIICSFISLTISLPKIKIQTNKKKIYMDNTLKKDL